MSFFGNTINQPREEKRLANISDDQLNSNQQAVPVKYLAGRSYVAGDYISPAYNPSAQPVKTQTGKGESTTTGYTYFASFALMFCMGGRRPVDAVYTVIVDSEIIWSGSIARTSGDYEVITVAGYGQIYLYWGSDTQAIDSLLLTPRGALGGADPRDPTTWPPNPATGGQVTFDGVASGDSNPFDGHYDQHSAYRGQCYAVFKNWKLGRDRTQIPNIQLELQRGCPWFSGGQIDSLDSGINPAAILFDWLTDTRFGMCMPEARLDETTFTALLTALGALGVNLSPVISQQNDFRSFVAQLLEYYDGWIRRNGDKLEVGLWSHGNIDTSGLPILTDDGLNGEPDLTPSGFGPTVNETTVIYRDREHHFNDYTQHYRDANNRRVVGDARPAILERPWITDAALAKSYATEYGVMNALPTNAGTLAIKREWLAANNALPGTLFKFNSAFYGLSFVCRLQEVETAADSSAEATLTVEVERGIWPSVYHGPPGAGAGDFVIGPRPLLRSRIIEVPPGLRTNNDLLQIIACATRRSTEIVGFRLWASNDGGSTYDNISERNTLAAYGYLNNQLNDTDDHAYVRLFGPDLADVVTQSDEGEANDTLLMIVCDPLALNLTKEIISVRRVLSLGDGLYWIDTRLRGRYGSTLPAYHQVSTDCFFVLREKLVRVDNANFIGGASLKFKFQPFTRLQDYDLSSVAAIDYDFVGYTSVPTPALAQGSSTFTMSFNIDMAIPAGFVVRYVEDASRVNAFSAEWPKSGGSYTTLVIDHSVDLGVRAFAPDGSASAQVYATYIRTDAATSGPVSFSFDHAQHHQAGTLAMACATSGATIKYKKNGGSTTTYSAPVSCALGDVFEAWSETSGMGNSPTTTFDNTFDPPEGGGGGSGGGHYPLP
jgi:hypothetical protein